MGSVSPPTAPGNEAAYSRNRAAMPGMPMVYPGQLYGGSPQAGMGHMYPGHPYGMYGTPYYGMYAPHHQQQLDGAPGIVRSHTAMMHCCQPLHPVTAPHYLQQHGMPPLDPNVPSFNPAMPYAGRIPGDRGYLMGIPMGGEYMDMAHAYGGRGYGTGRRGGRGRSGRGGYDDRRRVRSNTDCTMLCCTPPHSRRMSGGQAVGGAVAPHALEATTPTMVRAGVELLTTA